MGNKLIIYSDGGARGNPGPAAIGVVIHDEANKELARLSEYIGETTNNQAEYQALIRALEKSAVLGARELICYLDSELVVRQLMGQYKIREEGLKPLATLVLKLMKQFDSVEFKHVPREKNKLADKLVNEALDKKLS